MVGAVVRPQRFIQKDQSSNPGSTNHCSFECQSFSAKVDSTFHTYGVGKMCNSFCWGLICDGLVSRAGGVNDSRALNTTETKDNPGSNGPSRLVKVFSLMIRVRSKRVNGIKCRELQIVLLLNRQSQWLNFENQSYLHEQFLLVHLFISFLWKRGFFNFNCTKMPFGEQRK